MLCCIKLFDKSLDVLRIVLELFPNYKKPAARDLSSPARGARIMHTEVETGQQTDNAGRTDMKVEIFMYSH